MRAPRRLILGLAIVTACVEFKAVTATSQMGEKLAEYKTQVGLFERTCALLHATGTGTECPKQASSEKWEKALDMLVAYSKQLDAAASQQAPDVQDDVNAALGAAQKAGWTSLSDDTDLNISRVATAVAAFVSREATRDALQKTIRDVGPALDAVLALLVAHLRTEQEDLDMLRCNVACASGSPRDASACPPAAACKPPEPGTATLLVELEQRLDDEDAALTSTIRSVTAFGKAHHDLYAHVEHLDAKELYKAVLEDVTFTVASLDAGGGHD